MNDVFTNARSAITPALIESETASPGSYWSGGEYWTRNPMREDHELGSFSISADGLWYDFATGESGDLIDLVAARDGVPKREAAERIAGATPETASPRPAAKPAKPKPEAKIPIPEHFGREFNRHIRTKWSLEHRGTPRKAWKYRDATGAWLFGVVRFEKDGAKAVLPFYLGDDDRIHQGQPIAADRPLYRLPELVADPRKPVLVVEGEKAADAAQTLVGDDYVVTTWAGGSGAISKTDWTPLQGRDVIIWPDRDDPGRKAAQKIASSVKARIIDAGDGSDGWDAADALAEGWDADRVLQLIATAAPTDEQRVAREVPQVLIRNGELPQATREALDVLADDPALFQFGDGASPVLMRLSGNGLFPVGKEWLRAMLEDRIHFFKYDARAGVDVRKDCPERLPALILDSRGEWPFRKAAGIIHGPTIRLDGTILDQPGYDAATKLIYAPTGSSPKIPDAPTRQQIIDSLTTLWYPVAQFPYASAGDVSNALAMLLTASVRQVLDMAPGFSISAPAKGSGKTKLAKVAAIIATGSEPSVGTWADTDEERRKALLSLLTRAPGVVFFDNVTGQLKSAAMDRALSSPMVSDRVLGQTTEVDVPTRALFLFTGNNAPLSGDMTRRVLQVSLNAGVDVPWTREFAFDPVAETVERWADLRAAAITVLRGFYAAGAPKIGTAELGSFTQWDRMVRQAILWINREGLFSAPLTDPLETMLDIDQHNPDHEDLRDVLLAWADVFGSEPVTTRDLVEAGTRDSVTGSGKAHPDLHNALAAVAGDRGRINPKGVGRWLSYRVDRRVDGMAITRSRGDAHAKVQKWVLQIDSGAENCGVCGFNQLVSNPNRKMSNDNIGIEWEINPLLPQTPQKPTDEEILDEITRTGKGEL